MGKLSTIRALLGGTVDRRLKSGDQRESPNAIRPRGTRTGVPPAAPTKPSREPGVVSSRSGQDHIKVRPKAAPVIATIASESLCIFRDLRKGSG